MNEGPKPGGVIVKKTGRISKTIMYLRVETLMAKAFFNLLRLFYKHNHNTYIRNIYMQNNHNTTYLLDY